MENGKHWFVQPSRTTLVDDGLLAIGDDGFWLTLDDKQWDMLSRSVCDMHDVWACAQMGGGCAK
jgi:hypothetical protein